MSTSKRYLPNYLAYFIIIILISPLIILEIDNSIVAENSSEFYINYKNYIGWIMLFQFILFTFVFAQAIMQYDDIPEKHKMPMVIFSSTLALTLLLQFLSWLGYFNGGLFVFTWLSK